MTVAFTSYPSYRELIVNDIASIASQQFFMFWIPSVVRRISRVSSHFATPSFKSVCVRDKFATKSRYSLLRIEFISSSGAMGKEDYISIVKNSIKSYPDFPKPGVLFRDIFSLMRTPEALEALNKLLLMYIENLTPKPDIIVALEARGFLLGPLISLQTRIPFIPIRKKGKLPGKISQQSYELEYGVDTFEIQSESIYQGQNVIIVDDLLATGGSLQAACKLVNQLGAHVKECIVVMELLDLKGRDAVEVPIHSIVQY